MKNILGLITYFTLSIALIELYLNLTEIGGLTLTRYDEQFGVIPRQNINYLKFTESFFIGRTNDDGRFGDDYKREKPDGKIRIGLLGDSYVHGLDVLPRHHFGRILENDLNRDGEIFQVLGFGRGNFSLPLTYYYYKKHASSFDLDYVLFFLERRDFQGHISNPNVTRYEFKNGILTENFDWKERRIMKIMGGLDKIPILKYYDRLAFVNLFYRGPLSNVINDINWAVIFGKFSSTKSLLYPNTEYFESHEEGYWDGKNEEKSAISEQSKQFIDLLTKERVKVIFVTRNYPYKITKMETYLRNNNIQYFSLNEIFDGATIRKSGIDGNYFKATQMYGGHYNHHGHRAVGLFLAEKIREKIPDK